MKFHTAFCLKFVVSALFFTMSTAGFAERAEPVPLYGTYDMFLDRAKQTFNGHPVSTDRPVKQTEHFTTLCDESGCIAHSINKRPPPASFDYQWVNNHWESIVGQQKQFLVCNDGSKVDSIKVDKITPKGDGSFSGERVITVAAVGCPGDGPGKYALPFMLVPAK